MTEPGRYDFGDVRVDLRRMQVTVRGEPVALEPKSFDVLRYLIEHRDRLVGKDDLLNAIWGDAFVTPNVLTRAIAQLRRAIGDDAHDARYIETVARRGYRFLPPVVEVPRTTGCRRGAAGGGHRSGRRRAGHGRRCASRWRWPSSVAGRRRVVGDAPCAGARPRRPDAHSACRAG